VEFWYYSFNKAEKKRKILIAGAGLLAFRQHTLLPEKGHDVTVYEITDHIGGQFYHASRNPWGEGSDKYWDDQEFMRFVNYLKAQCDKFGAKIIFNTRVTIRSLSKRKGQNQLKSLLALSRKFPVFLGQASQT